MNRYIAVEYNLYTEDENGKHLRERTRENQPFTFISGMGYTLEAFEKHIIDVPQGEEFDFTLTADEAYGQIDEKRILELDHNIFSINGHFDHDHIYKGADVPMQNEDGMKLFGHVVDITEEKVIMDFNHPLAGEIIEYKGKVLENRDATTEEIDKFIAFLSGSDEDGCSCGHCHHDGCGHGECGGHDHHCECKNH
ncbi:MAG: FKBP-type peptidyl-prolyl cis-trans isomerase [Bacteroidaceae bacterium]|nr:FKBP-type peptidyl-prolyl cis-trans isomerase [Bacteroidaceae bacterium]